MVSRIFLSTSLTIFLAAGSSAQASPLDDLVRDWRAMPSFEEGIQVTPSGVISSFQTVLRPGDSEERTLILTESEAVLQAARAVIAENNNDTTLQGILKNHFASKKVSLPGHVLLSECSQGLCRSVYAMTKDEWAKAKERIQHTRFTDSFESFKTSPFADSSLLDALGQPDLSLLSDLRRTSDIYANVRTAIIPISGIMKKALAFEEKRDAGVRSLIDSGAKHDLVLHSIYAAESPKAYAEKLAQAGIPSLAWHPDTPTLRQIARVQGFVRYDGRAKNELPTSMDFIQQCFAEGRNLDVVIELLEAAAERAPATPEVWEYLAAAYLAANRPGPAQIAARVWFVTSKEPKAAGLWLLNKFRSDTRSKELLSFLESSSTCSSSK